MAPNLMNLELFEMSFEDAVRINNDLIDCLTKIEELSPKTPYVQDLKENFISRIKSELGNLKNSKVIKEKIR